MVIKGTVTPGNFLSTCSVLRNEFSLCKTSCLSGVTQKRQRNVSCKLFRFQSAHKKHFQVAGCYTAQFLKKSLQLCVKSGGKQNSILISATVSATSLATFMAVARHGTLGTCSF